jgi:hypothetical protein
MGIKHITQDVVPSAENASVLTRMITVGKVAMSELHRTSSDYASGL